MTAVLPQPTAVRAESPAARYLEIVAPVNEVVGLFNAAGDDTTRAQMIHAMAMVFTSTRDELDDFDWPPEAQHPARDVALAAMAASAAAETLLSRLTEDAAAAFAAEADALATASSTMRQALGLEQAQRR